MINIEKNIYKNEFDSIFICNDNINLLDDPFNFFLLDTDCPENVS